MDDFIDVVYMSLDGPDPPRGVQRVYLCGFRLRELLAPRVRKCPQELGPGGLLVVGARIGLRELKLSDGIIPVAKFRCWGVASGGWDPGASSAFGSWCWCGSDRSATRPMITASAVAAM
jgi:hypothetical protein